MKGLLVILGVWLALINATAQAENLVVQLSPNKSIAVANAVERGSAVTVGGVVQGNRASFANLRTDTAYDLAIEQTDGTLLCGADMSWCDETPPDPNAEALGDDDREQIRAIVQDIPQFGNKPRILAVQGNHDRAVVLVESSRTKGFYSDKGNEAIWRVEVWYFKWQTGAWERVPNQNRILRRERFKTMDAYEKELRRVRWVPELGGVQLKKGSATTTLKLPEINPPATTASGSSEDSGPKSNRP